MASRSREEERAREAAAALREMGMVPLTEGPVSPLDPAQRVAEDRVSLDEVAPFLREVGREGLLVRARTRITAAGAREVTWAPRWAVVLAVSWAQGRSGDWVGAARAVEEDGAEAVSAMFALGGHRAVAAWARSIAEDRRGA